MRIWILIALLPCALLAQTSPPRPADASAFQKLPPRLAWFQPAAGAPQSEWKFRWFGSPDASMSRRGAALAALPGVCSIPLLRAPIPEGVIDRMSVPAPRAKDFDPKFVLPTPPVCEDRKP